MAQKRKSISLDQKREICHQLQEKKCSQAEICRIYGYSKSTVNTIWKEKNTYLAVPVLGTAKKIRKATLCDVDEAMNQWFNQVRSMNVPLSGPIVREKALKFAQELGHTDFKASEGWLNSFRQRHSIVFKRVNGEGNDAPKEDVRTWKEKLPSLLSDYEEHDIFNLDETALFFKMMPNNTLTIKKDPCIGGKGSKERLTLLLGANMDGSEKLPLLAIGRSAKPRSFKNVQRLPIEYCSNKKAWMTRKSFNLNNELEV